MGVESFQMATSLFKVPSSNWGWLVMERTLTTVPPEVLLCIID
jgi:hypothetical protein